MSRRGWVLFVLAVDVILLASLVFSGSMLRRALLLTGLVVAAVVPFVLVVATIAVRRYFPRELRLEPGGSIRGDVAALDERYRALGFTRAGAPKLLATRPPLTVVGYAHPDTRSYACITRARLLGMPSVTHGFVSLLADDDVTFETMCLATGDTELPAPPGAVRQVFRNLEPDELLDRHREGLVRLEARGGRLRAARADAFADEFVATMDRVRRHLAEQSFLGVMFGIVIGSGTGYRRRRSSPAAPAPQSRKPTDA